VRIDFLTKRGKRHDPPIARGRSRVACNLLRGHDGRSSEQACQTQQARSIAEQCAREHGAGYDPVSKQLVMYATERDAMVKLDAHSACVSRRTGVPQRWIPVHEKPLNTPG
jgi:hypothetical protein